MIDAQNIQNMPQFLEALSAQAADRGFLKYMDGMQVVDVSASRFFNRVRQCAAQLVSRGLSGKHIGIMGANRVEWLISFCAVFQANAVAVLISPDLNAQELSDCIGHADVQALLHDETLRETVSHSPVPEHLTRLSMDQLPEAGSGCSLPEGMAEPDSNDLACILFTSGTTAVSKAVMLSQRAMVAGVCHNVIGFPFASQLAILPFHHVAGFASVLNTWYLGATVCIGQDMKYLFRYLEHMKPDYTLTVPSLLQVIVKKLQKGGPNGHLLGWDLHMLGCGGAQFPPEVIRFLNDHQIRVLQSYGATEAGGLGFDWEMTPECQDTLGKPCKEIETKIVDGELYLRSASVMMGYYQDPQGTEAVLKDGWYATGDLCEQDEAGFLHLRGRKKNLIILSNGENVSPEQIEAALSACGMIEEVMVGVENHLITATVYPKEPGDCTPAQRDAIHDLIREAVHQYNRGVPSYRQVQNLKWIDRPFAKTEIGKLIRRSVTGGNSL